MQGYSQVVGQGTPWPQQQHLPCLQHAASFQYQLCNFLWDFTPRSLPGKSAQPDSITLLLWQQSPRHASSPAEAGRNMQTLWHQSQPHLTEHQETVLSQACVGSPCPMPWSQQPCWCQPRQQSHQPLYNRGQHPVHGTRKRKAPGISLPQELEAADTLLQQQHGEA